MNARDDIFNGATRPRPPSRNAVELGMAEAECRRALDEFNVKMPKLMQRLDLPPAVLHLAIPELLILICIRQQAVIDDLAQTVQRLAFPPVVTEDTTP